MFRDLKSNTASTKDWVKATEAMRIFAYEPVQATEESTRSTKPVAVTPKKLPPKK